MRSCDEIQASLEQRANSLEYKQYNFRLPDRLSKDQIKNIKKHFDAIPRHLANYLTRLVRSRVDCDFKGIEQIYYKDTLAPSIIPRILGVFHIQSTDFSGSIEISTPMFYGMMDHLFGGNGELESPIRAITDLEKHISKEIFTKVMDYHWKLLPLGDVKYTLDQIESDTLMISKDMAENEIMVSLHYKITTPHLEGYLNLHLPYSFLTPVFPKGSVPRKEQESDKGNMSRDLVKKKFGQIKLPVTVQFNPTKITARQVADLMNGSRVILNHPVDQDLSVLVSGRLKFLAKPGQRGNELKIKITKIVEDDY